MQFINSDQYRPEPFEAPIHLNNDILKLIAQDAKTGVDADQAQAMGVMFMAEMARELLELRAAA